MTDHVHAAIENLTLADMYPDGYRHLTTADLIAIAQVHATLALVAAQPKPVNIGIAGRV
jgi:hypothetical protein